MKITVVGLGSGSTGSISYGAYQAVREARDLFLRTKEHPIVEKFDEEGITYRSFDPFYEVEGSFEAVYQKIADFLIDQVKEKAEIVYAVPGHPRVAESSVELLLSDERVKNGEIGVSIIPSQSFLDDLFVFLDVDPTKRGFLLLDALSFEKESLHAKTDLVFSQVYNKYIASELKLRLMEYWAAETPVILFKRAGIPGQEEKRNIFLYELDRTDLEFDHLTSLFVPHIDARQKFKTIFDLVDTIARLRGEDGCPWDKKQTAKSLIPHLKGEVEELILAIEADDVDNIIEELGDVLMILALEARIGEEEFLFDMDEVIDGIVQKLIFRHPHVFGDQRANSLDEANFIWKQQKIKEKRDKSIEND
ncbi:MAG: MazG nucleotide pyrophosphohydrolase domain-containing protein [Peptostreptococcaceae bacterium]|nr:MazG nucleotide pyrophosphohydrolase domain-containing protein [Peptostreptococcaceae bacterium]